MARADDLLSRLQTTELMIRKARCNKPEPRKRISSLMLAQDALMAEAKEAGALDVEIHAALSLEW